jgi:hypothetical protein
MSNHLLQCASKTTKCSKCQKYIQRAIYAYHLDNNCVDLDVDETIFIKNSEFVTRMIKLARSIYF